MRIGGNFGGGSGAGADPREAPEPDIYEAVICLIEPVGKHKERNDPDRSKEKVCIGFELEWRNSKGQREILFRKHTLGLWKSPDGTKATDFRVLLDTVFPDKVAGILAAGGEIETNDWVGRQVRVQVETDARGRAIIKGVMRSKKDGTPEAMRAERDCSQPFGLWKWLIENQERA
ncbi:MAG: hypothetical protein VKP62_16710 [Candidatus Sericytochromatia bacterium]|nr:hypothetical protein [Candidatus Sericytochromatia bacterium]